MEINPHSYSSYLKTIALYSSVPLFPCARETFEVFLSGKIRFSEARSATHGIHGPIDNLWLDYSQVTGMLNQMLVYDPGGSANVRIYWESIYNDVGLQNCASWRVSVKATKPITPFEPLVREAA